MLDELVEEFLPVLKPFFQFCLRAYQIVNRNGGERLTAAERLGPLRVCFGGVQGVFWSKGDGGNRSDSLDAPEETTGTTSLVDLVKMRFPTFRETSVRVTTALLLKGMFWRIPTETRRPALLDLGVFVATMGYYERGIHRAGV